MTKRVLVTGAGGVCGREVCRELMARGHSVHGLIRRHRETDPPVAEMHMADLADAAAIDAAADGMDAIVHMAATPDPDDYMTRLLPNNIVGIYNIFEAARNQGVHRFVLASSAQVAWGLPNWRKAIIRVEAGTAPTNHYGLAKVYAEQMGRMYAAVYSLSVVAIRMGWLPRDQQLATSLAADQWGHATYFSPPDVGRAFACAVETEDDKIGGFAPIYASSRSPRHDRGLDLEPARRVIGFEPQDTWPQNLPKQLLAKVTVHGTGTANDRE